MASVALAERHDGATDSGHFQPDPEGDVKGSWQRRQDAELHVPLGLKCTNVNFAYVNPAMNADARPRGINLPPKDCP